MSVGATCDSRCSDDERHRPSLDCHPSRRDVRVALEEPDGVLTVRVWDVASGRRLHDLRGHIGDVYTAAFSPDNTLAFTTSLDGKARIWDVASGRLRNALDIATTAWPLGCHDGVDAIGSSSHGADRRGGLGSFASLIARKRIHRAGDAFVQRPH